MPNNEYWWGDSIKEEQVIDKDSQERLDKNIEEHGETLGHLVWACNEDEGVKEMILGLSSEIRKGLNERLDINERKDKNDNLED